MHSFLVTCSHGTLAVSFILMQIWTAKTSDGALDDVTFTADGACERKSRDGDMLSVHYVGRLDSDGTVFDSSGDADEEPFVFQLGRRQVIAGLDRGLLGMCVGDRRILRIPSALAYGNLGSGDRVPPDSNVVFEVELVNIGDPPSSTNVFRLVDRDRDGQLSRQEVGDYLRRQIPAATMEADELLVDPPTFDQDRMVNEIFQHEDKDKDNFISHEEFSGPKHDEL